MRTRLYLAELGLDKVRCRQIVGCLLGALVLGYPHLAVLQLQVGDEVCEGASVLLATFGQPGVSSNSSVKVVQTLAMPVLELP